MPLCSLVWDTPRVFEVCVQRGLASIMIYFAKWKKAKNKKTKKGKENNFVNAFLGNVHSVLFNLNCSLFFLV